MAEPRTESCEVVVIGGGPAGAMAGATLAMRGRRVVVLEKEATPGYRVGESLIPYCWYPLERVGAVDAIEGAGFTHKHSVQFVSGTGRVTRPFYFSDHHAHPSSRTWQVDRETFDRVLRSVATGHGAELRMGWTAKKLVEDGGRVVGVDAVDASGEPVRLDAQVVIDASGRDGFVMRQRSWRRPEPRLNRIAIWTYVQGALRDAGADTRQARSACPAAKRRALRARGGSGGTPPDVVDGRIGIPH